MDNSYLYIAVHYPTMGLLDSLPEGPIRGRLKNGDKSLDEITLADLKEQFGADALARGLAYMESLTDADKSYREAANGQYTEGLQRKGVEMDETTEQKADEAWAKGMEETGIGIENVE